MEYNIGQSGKDMAVLLVCNMNGIRYLLFDYEAYITSAVERKYRATIRMLKPMATFMLRNCVDAGSASINIRAIAVCSIVKGL